MGEFVPLKQPVTNTPLAKIENKFVLDDKSIIKEEVKTKKIDPKIVEVKKQEPPVIVVKTKKKVEDINILVSYYSNSVEDCGNDKGISASGKNLVTLSRGGNPTYVAAPKNIPFNTKIDVEGIGVCDVQDRGGAIKHVWLDGIEYMKLDVFVKGATRKELLNKGLLKTKGRIIE